MYTVSLALNYDYSDGKTSQLSVAHKDKNDKDEQKADEDPRRWNTYGTRAGSGASYLLDDDELACRILGERVHHRVERVHHTRALPCISPRSESW
jgi:hypothetical protein